MQTKMMTITEVDEAGKGLAVLARMDEIDHDGDTYAAGAFAWKGDQWAPLLPAHNRSKMPFGKARVFERDGTAYAELHLNLDTQAGREWHAALKFDLAKGRAVQEYSYGFDVIDAEDRASPQGRVRVLRRLDVHEVSTVVRGAGLGTGTVSMKALKEAGFAPLLAGLSELAGALKGDPAALSATGRKQLEAIHAEIGRVLANEDKAATRLSRALNEMIAARAGDDDDARSALIDRMAGAAGIERGTVLQILRGDIAVPPPGRIAGFARVLDVPVGRLEALIERGEDDALPGKAFGEAMTAELARHLSRDARIRHGN